MEPNRYTYLPPHVAADRDGWMGALEKAFHEKVHKTRQGIFAVLYVVSKQAPESHAWTDDALTWAAQLIGFMQMNLFLIFPRANFAWSNTIDPLRYTASITALFGVHSGANQNDFFFTRFALAGIWSALFSCFSIWNVLEFAHARIPSTQALRLLRLAAFASASVLFIPCLQMLFSVFQCRPTTIESYSPWQRIDAVCLSGWHLGLTVVSVLLASAFGAVVFVFKFIYIESHPLSPRVSGLATSRAEVILLLVKVVLVVCVQTVPEVFGPNALVGILFVAACAWLGSQLWYLPFTHHAANRGQIAMASVFLLGVVALAVAQGYTGDAAAVLLFGGAPFAALAGVLAADLRYRRILRCRDASCFWSPSEVDVWMRGMLIEAALSAMRAVLPHENSGSEPAESSALLTAREVDAPSLQPTQMSDLSGAASPQQHITESAFSALDSVLERTAAINAWLPEAARRAALKMLRDAALRFPRSALVQLSLARFYDIFSHQKWRAAGHLLRALRLGAPLDIAFLAFAARRSADPTASSTSVHGVIRQLAFEKALQDTIDATMEASARFADLTRELCESKPRMSYLLRFAGNHLQACADGEAAIAVLIAINPQSVDALRQIARFRRSAVNDSVGAQAAHEDAQRFEDVTRSAHQRSIQDAMHSGARVDARTTRTFGRMFMYSSGPPLVQTESSAVFIVSAEPNSLGRILHVSDTACALFGYLKHNLERRDISIIIPAPIASAHRGFMAAYLSTGESAAGDRSRVVLALHRIGHLLPVVFSIRDLTARDMAGTNAGRFHAAFVGVIEPLKTTGWAINADEYILARDDADLLVTSATPGALRLLGFATLPEPSAAGLCLRTIIPSWDSAQAALCSQLGANVDIVRMQPCGMCAAPDCVEADVTGAGQPMPHASMISSLAHVQHIVVGCCSGGNGVKLVIVYLRLAPVLSILVPEPSPPFLQHVAEGEQARAAVVARHLLPSRYAQRRLSALCSDFPADAATDVVEMAHLGRVVSAEPRTSMSDPTKWLPITPEPTPRLQRASMMSASQAHHAAEQAFELLQQSSRLGFKAYRMPRALRWLWGSIVVVVLLNTLLAGVSAAVGALLFSSFVQDISVSQAVSDTAIGLFRVSQIIQLSQIEADYSNRIDGSVGSLIRTPMQFAVDAEDLASLVTEYRDDLIVLQSLTAGDAQAEKTLQTPCTIASFSNAAILRNIGASDAVNAPLNFVVDGTVLVAPLGPSGSDVEIASVFQATVLHAAWELEGSAALIAAGAIPFSHFPESSDAWSVVINTAAGSSVHDQLHGLIGRGYNYVQQSDIRVRFASLSVLLIVVIIAGISTTLCIAPNIWAVRSLHSALLSRLTGLPHLELVLIAKHAEACFRDAVRRECVHVDESEGVYGTTPISVAHEQASIATELVSAPLRVQSSYVPQLEAPHAELVGAGVFKPRLNSINSPSQVLNALASPTRHVRRSSAVSVGREHISLAVPENVVLVLDTPPPVTASLNVIEPVRCCKMTFFYSCCRCCITLKPLLPRAVTVSASKYVAHVLSAFVVFFISLLLISPLHGTLFGSTSIAMGTVSEAEAYYTLALQRAGLILELDMSVVSCISATGPPWVAANLLRNAWQSLVDLDTINRNLMFASTVQGRAWGSGPTAVLQPGSFDQIISRRETAGVAGIAEDTTRQISEALLVDACPLVSSIAPKNHNISVNDCRTGGVLNVGLQKALVSYMSLCEKILQLKADQLADAIEAGSFVPRVGFNYSAFAVLASPDVALMRELAFGALYPAYDFIAYAYAAASLGTARSQGTFLVLFASAFSASFMCACLVVGLSVVYSMDRALRRIDRLLLHLPHDLLVSDPLLVMLVQEALLKGGMPATLSAQHVASVAPCSDTPAV